MRARGSLAAVVVVVVIAGALAAERWGPATPLAAPSPEALSDVWLCPHGGGDGWTATISIANPGSSDVQVRLRPLDDRGSGDPLELVVPAGHEVQQVVPDDRPSSATVVEAFGGWVSAGWIVHAAAPDGGIGAEPCTPGAGRHWFAAGASTQRGEQASLIVMNPFAVDAVFDVVLFSSRPALRRRALSDVVLKAGRSMAIPVTKLLVDEAAIGAEVDASVGRVAVATLGLTAGAGIRSVLATPAPSATVDLPTAAGSGQGSLQVTEPGDRDARFSATAWASDGPAPAGGLLSQEQRSSSAGAYPTTTSGPTVISLSALGGPTLFAALRSQGQGDDDAAAGGAAVPAPGWVVPPTAAGRQPMPRLFVANPGSEPVEVTVRLLTPDDSTPSSVSFTVQPASTAAAPSPFLAQAPTASVLVTADGDVVAAGASTSGGARGLSLYAIALGVPVPDGVLPPA